MTPEERFEFLAKEYRSKFGEFYPVFMTTMLSTEELIADIEDCLRTGKKKEIPDLQEGVDY